MLNWIPRYSSVLDIINTKGMTDSLILELGSGSHGLGCCFDKPFVGLDTEFPDPISPNMIPILASIDHVPFSDDSFDLVVSLDMLEHIPADKRLSVIQQMLRVSSRFVIIGFPCGEIAEQAERHLASWFERDGGNAPPWLQEHLQNGLPSSQEVEEYLDTIPNMRHEVFGNENVAFHIMVVIADHIDISRDYSEASLVDNRDDWIELCKKANFSPVYRSIYLIEKLESNETEKIERTTSGVYKTLVCPRCRAELTIDDPANELTCLGCSSKYCFTEDHIPDMRCR